MATIETSEPTTLAERALMNNRTILEQAFAELDPGDETRRQYLLNWQRILEMPPIESDLDPVQLIREDRDR
jgi:hypothetical protein